MSHVVDIAAGAGWDRALVGNKGAGLARIHELGTEIDAALAGLEARRGLRLGDPAAPLLLSVRSGAPVSMPGMMDTVLNLGINDDVEEGLGRSCDDPAFARNTH